MKVRFKKTDPRGGGVVELPDERAQELIDSGAAQKVSDDTDTNGYGAPAGTDTGTTNPSGRKATDDTASTKDASTRKGAANKAAEGGGEDGKETK